MSSSGYPSFMEERAIIEAGKILEAVNKHGPYSSVVFDSTVTQSVIARTYGAWPRLCNECNVKGFRREFARAWMAYFRQGVRLFGYLPGVIETINRNNSFHEYISPPELIGNPEIALFVLKKAKESGMDGNLEAEE